MMELLMGTRHRAERLPKLDHHQRRKKKPRSELKRENMQPVSLLSSLLFITSWIHELVSLSVFTKPDLETEISDDQTSAFLNYYPLIERTTKRFLPFETSLLVDLRKVANEHEFQLAIRRYLIRRNAYQHALLDYYVKNYGVPEHVGGVISDKSTVVSEVATSPTITITDRFVTEVLEINSDEESDELHQFSIGPHDDTVTPADQKRPNRQHLRDYPDQVTAQRKHPPTIEDAKTRIPAKATTTMETTRQRTTTMPVMTTTAQNTSSGAVEQTDSPDDLEERIATTTVAPFPSIASTTAFDTAIHDSFKNLESGTENFTTTTIRPNPTSQLLSDPEIAVKHLTESEEDFGMNQMTSEEKPWSIVSEDEDDLLSMWQTESSTSPHSSTADDYGSGTIPFESHYEEEQTESHQITSTGSKEPHTVTFKDLIEQDTEGFIGTATTTGREITSPVDSTAAIHDHESGTIPSGSQFEEEQTESQQIVSTSSKERDTVTFKDSTKKDSEGFIGKTTTTMNEITSPVDSTTAIHDHESGTIPSESQFKEDEETEGHQIASAGSKEPGTVAFKDSIEQDTEGFIEKTTTTVREITSPVDSTAAFRDHESGTIPSGSQFKEEQTESHQIASTGSKVLDTVTFKNLVEQDTEGFIGTATTTVREITSPVDSTAAIHDNEPGTIPSESQFEEEEQTQSQQIVSTSSKEPETATFKDLIEQDTEGFIGKTITTVREITSPPSDSTVAMHDYGSGTIPFESQFEEEQTESYQIASTGSKEPDTVTFKDLVEQDTEGFIGAAATIVREITNPVDSTVAIHDHESGTIPSESQFEEEEEQTKSQQIVSTNSKEPDTVTFKDLIEQDTEGFLGTATTTVKEIASPADSTVAFYDHESGTPPSESQFEEEEEQTESHQIASTGSKEPGAVTFKDSIEQDTEGFIRTATTNMNESTSPVDSTAAIHDHESGTNPSESQFEEEQTESQQIVSTSSKEPDTATFKDSTKEDSEEFIGKTTTTMNEITSLVDSTTAIHDNEPGTIPSESQLKEEEQTESHQIASTGSKEPDTVTFKDSIEQDTEGFIGTATTTVKEITSPVDSTAAIHDMKRTEKSQTMKEKDDTAQPLPFMTTTDDNMVTAPMDFDRPKEPETLFAPRLSESEAPVEELTSSSILKTEQLTSDEYTLYEGTDEREIDPRKSILKSEFVPEFTTDAYLMESVGTRTTQSDLVSEISAEQRHSISINDFSTSTELASATSNFDSLTVDQSAFPKQTANSYTTTGKLHESTVSQTSDQSSSISYGSEESTLYSEDLTSSGSYSEISTNSFVDYTDIQSFLSQGTSDGDEEDDEDEDDYVTDYEDSSVIPEVSETSVPSGSDPVVKVSYLKDDASSELRKANYRKMSRTNGLNSTQSPQHETEQKYSANLHSNPFSEDGSFQFGTEDHMTGEAKSPREAELERRYNNIAHLLKICRDYLKKRFGTASDQS
ncbi:hypothetical protein ACOME3_006563 [Neoechinorhynchus agilis]